MPGMSCANCTAAIERELSRVHGVASVSADLGTKVVTVHGAGFSEADLRRAIDEAGYEVDDGDA